jgi:hypothetical protein
MINEQNIIRTAPFVIRYEDVVSVVYSYTDLSIIRTSVSLKSLLSNETTTLNLPNPCVTLRNMTISSYVDFHIASCFPEIELERSYILTLKEGLVSFQNKTIKEVYPLYMYIIGCIILYVQSYVATKPLELVSHNFQKKSMKSKDSIVFSFNQPITHGNGFLHLYQYLPKHENLILSEVKIPSSVGTIDHEKRKTISFTLTDLKLNPNSYYRVRNRNKTKV